MDGNLRESRPTDRFGWSPKGRFLIAVAALLGSAVLIARGGRVVGGRPPPRMLRVDPNSAPPQVLGALPRIGPALAGSIVKERQKRPFASLDDLDDRVRGIGPATREALRPYLRFEQAGETRTEADPGPLRAP